MIRRRMLPSKSEPYLRHLEQGTRALRTFVAACGLGGLALSVLFFRDGAVGPGLVSAIAGAAAALNPWVLPSHRTCRLCGARWGRGGASRHAATHRRQLQILSGALVRCRLCDVHVQTCHVRRHNRRSHRAASDRPLWIPPATCPACGHQSTLRRMARHLDRRHDLDAPAQGLHPWIQAHTGWRSRRWMVRGPIIDGASFLRAPTSNDLRPVLSAAILALASHGDAFVVLPDPGARHWRPEGADRVARDLVRHVPTHFAFAPRGGDAGEIAKALARARAQPLWTVGAQDMGQERANADPVAVRIRVEKSGNIKVARRRSMGGRRLQDIAGHLRQRLRRAPGPPLRTEDELPWGVEHAPPWRAG